MKNKKVALLILDGWGIGNGSKADAIAHANTPVMAKLVKTHPHAQLGASGLDVGLPAGQMGNSEVGHLNIGAGRVIYQELVKINIAIENNLLEHNQILNDCFAYLKQSKKKLHFMGLLSDGCIHSSEKHLFHLLELAEKNNVPAYFVHAFTDGRDTDPKSGKGFVKQLEKKLEGTNGRIASIIGRYYAMDRDKRWERIKIAWDMLTSGQGEKSLNVLETIEKRYQAGETDEFLKPIINQNGFEPIAPGDAVICFNYRTDRCREITVALTQANMPDQGMHTLPLHYLTLTNYDDAFKQVYSIFPKDDLKETLGEILANAGKTQLRIAETEKYPHVTFFFNGGRELPFAGEERIMVPSPKVATYDLQPEMSAAGVRDEVIRFVEEKQPDFICLNFANPDMVGHTGVYPAIIKAVETVDTCLGAVLSCLENHQYSVIIIADHGNADNAI
ncbi:MAG: 2,3-bisphosphoglycerate-independent phosphoglycerate mutase, partial [Bacteroidia bacterium]|nr:2,3-bisphosphoglycerate-independent phosphoglycerate mutase [Bacteroidia bacterium]